jgi:CubicO group peptidase (beta-lactamase class C family)
MSRVTASLALVLALCLFCNPVAARPAVDGVIAPTREGLDAFLQKVLAEQALPGIAVIVARRQGSGLWRDVIREYYGVYKPDTVEPVASATKWYTGATVEAVVEDGKLRLDDPISRWIPDVPPDKLAITVRQTLSHVSGLPQFGPVAERQNRDLAESVRKVLAAPLVGKPGTVMNYSGTALQVAARAAEIASGKPWRALFAERIAKPLSLQHTTYGVTGEGAPVTGGGLRTTPAEMEVFTRMIANGGEDRGVRVLKPDTVRDMARLITRGSQVLDVPAVALSYPGMGTGEWCQSVDAAGRCTSVASIGAFGAYAWVDYAKGLYGVFFVRGRLNEIMPKWILLRAAVETMAATQPPTERTR